MRKTIALLGFTLTLIGSSYSQHMPGSFSIGGPPAERMQVRSLTSHDPNFKKTSALSFYKRKSEWRKIIDSTWGPGLPLAQKLGLFDYFSNYVRSHNPTFAYTGQNWDSVSAYWRSKVTDATSRGGFSAILSYLAYQLNDAPHAWAADNILYSTPLNPGTPILVGVPFDIFRFGPQHFGAGLTVLADSSILVYRVVPNHPLGLEPGDIILGYEGVSWRQLLRELMAGQIPLALINGTSPSTSDYYLQMCAGQNWHLFDTIDVLKYKTGQTVHLSTDTLISLSTPAASVDGGQLPIAGVQMPGWSIGANGYANSAAIEYGTVQGTNIGYIYVYHEQYDGVDAEFDAAVAALAQTDGLIIDIRFNNGGWVYLNAGIGRLTNYAGPTLTPMVRSSATDLLALTPTTVLDYSIPQDGLHYRHPVAVLLGPACYSAGDIIAREMTFLDTVRFFGKSPKGIYSGGWSYLVPLPSWPGFDLSCASYTFINLRSPNEQLWGKEFPIDEHVWLTRDGVAKGEDDVVKRALEWIGTASGIAEGNLQLPHDFSLSQNYPNPFNPSTTITYELPKSSVVRLSVFDLLGREVSVLVNERKNAGSYEVKFDAAGLSSGVYFYRLQAGDFVQTKRLLLLK